MNNKRNISLTQVTFPLLLMLALGKNFSFIKYSYFGRNNKSSKTANKISIVTFIIKGQKNCKINYFSRFHRGTIKIIVIFIEKNLTLRFAYNNIGKRANREHALNSGQNV